MWWLMMFAMMLPSAAPAILLYGHVRRMRGADAEIAQSWIFLAGYLAAWLLFSLAAASAQLLLTGVSWIWTAGTLGWICHIIAAYFAYRYAKDHPVR